MTLPASRLLDGSRLPQTQEADWKSAASQEACPTKTTQSIYAALPPVSHRRTNRFCTELYLKQHENWILQATETP
jgi:hypothetical protein